MKAIDFWFDPISPYAYLAFERLPEAFVGLSYRSSYRPIVFGALLKAFAHKGPAEIEPKRAWTFRQVHWLAPPRRHPDRHAGAPSVQPARAVAPGLGHRAGRARRPSRYACETILRHVWRGGADAEDAGAPRRARARSSRRAVDPASDAVKQRLRDATDAALARGVFGVPTLGIDDKLFWGFDALDMAAGYVRGDPWFDAPHWEREGAPRARRQALRPESACAAQHAPSRRGPRGFTRARSCRFFRFMSAKVTAAGQDALGSPHGDS